MPLNNGTLLLWHPRLLPQIFLVVELHPPIPSGFLVTTGSRLSPGLLSPDPTFQHPACLHLQTHLRLGCTGLWHGPPVEVSLCPACHRLLSSEPLKVPSVLAELSTGEGASTDARTSPHLQLHARGSGPIILLILFLFPFSYLTWFYGDLSCPFINRCLRSSTSVQQVLYDDFSMCRCILDESVGER